MTAESLPQGPLPLIILAAIDHPDSSFCDHLWVMLYSWLDELGPLISDDEADLHFSRVRGTDLEPFRLSGTNLKIAKLLYRAAFSARLRCKRFRIVSEQTIGSSGGAIFTGSGQYFYSERYVRGKHRSMRDRYCFYAPCMKVHPPTRSNSWKPVPAEVSVTDLGLSVIVNDIESSRLATSLDPKYEQKISEAFQKNSTIGRPGQPLDKFGLKVSFSDGRLCLNTGSPESLIRLAAYMANGDFIHIKPQSSDTCNYQMSIQLPPSGNGPGNCILQARDRFALGWMSVSGFGAPSLSIEDIRKITEWALPHESWVSIDNFQGIT